MKSSIFRVVAVVAVAASIVVWGVTAHASPPCTPGSNCAAVGTDAAFNLSVGTSTTQSNTKFLIVASSTGDTSNYAMKIWDHSQNPLFLVRNDGSIAIGTSSFTGGAVVTVNGTLAATTLTGTYGGFISAGNLQSGEFGSNAGNGNFSFPASVSINSTTTPSGGVLYVNGNVGIGTASPVTALTVAGNVSSTGLCLGGTCSATWPSGLSGGQSTYIPV